MLADVFARVLLEVIEGAGEDHLFLCAPCGDAAGCHGLLVVTGIWRGAGRDGGVWRGYYGRGFCFDGWFAL